MERLIAMNDFTYLSLGAGLQSSTIAEMIVEGELPRVDLALFADTGDEPDYVYAQVDYLKGRLKSVNVPLETVTIGNMLEHLREQDHRFVTMPIFTVDRETGKAGKMKRQCTSEYKIAVIEKRVKQELLKRGMATKDGRGISVNGNKDNKVYEIECWLGISLDEAVSRMKENPEWWVDNRWPLIEMKMKRHDCALWLQRKGLPFPKKSSCRVCPFHSDAHFRWMKEYRPEDWQHVVEFDHWLRDGNGNLTASAKGELYLHSQCVPIDEANLDSEQDKGQMDFCDEGYYGI